MQHRFRTEFNISKNGQVLTGVPKGGIRNVRTPENVKRVRVAMEVVPCRSVVEQYD